jgi:hypothetical protein
MEPLFKNYSNNFCHKQTISMLNQVKIDSKFKNVLFSKTNQYSIQL